jgi:hypothetical protein
MSNWLIEVSLRNRFLIIVGFLLLGGWGYWALLTTAIDAIPDLSDNQVIVFTDWPGRSPQEVEDQITYPLTVNLQGLPGVRVVRSSSAFGFSMINMTSLCTQCMNRLNQGGVAREGLQRRRFIGPEERGSIVLVGLQRREVKPGERVFAVSPDPLKRVQLWAIGRQAHEAHVGREGEPLGGVGPAVVQEQEIQAVREALGEGSQEELEALRVEIRQLQEEPVARGRLHGAIDRQPLEDLLHRANRRHAARGEAPPADGQAAATAVVLAKDPDGSGVRRGDRPLEAFLTGGLECRDGLRLLWCDWGAGP